MVYHDKFVVFIDVLGFRDLINRTSHDEKLAQSIYDVLSTFKPEHVSLETYGQLHREMMRPGEEAEVRKHLAVAAQALSKTYPITYTHFSDSLVISCDIEQEDTCFIILELLGRLNFRLWEEHQLVVRGGITIGKLVHEQNGVLFGPAMVRAYDLESKEAVYPRILIDIPVTTSMTRSSNYERMKPLFDTAENGMAEISLASSFAYLLQSIFTLHPITHNKYLTVVQDSIPSLERIRDSQSIDKIRSKYAWLTERVKNTYEGLPDGARTMWSVLK